MTTAGQELWVRNIRNNAINLSLALAAIGLAIPVFLFWDQHRAQRLLQVINDYHLSSALILSDARVEIQNILLLTDPNPSHRTILPRSDIEHQSLVNASLHLTRRQIQRLIVLQQRFDDPAFRALTTLVAQRHSELADVRAHIHGQQNANTVRRFTILLPVLEQLQRLHLVTYDALVAQYAGRDRIRLLFLAGLLLIAFGLGYLSLRRSLGAITRLTDQQQTAERALRESEARLQQAVQIARLGYVEYDAINDLCEYCSEYHALQHGLTPAEYIEKVSKLEGEMTLTHPEDRAFVRNNYRRLRQGTPIEMEYRVLTVDGEVRFVREVFEPVMDESGRVIREIGASIDITDLRRAEMQLQQTQKMEAIGRLTAGVAHDFNNLLAVILGNLELAIQDIEKDEVRKMITGAIGATTRGEELTRRLLTFGRRAVLYPENLNANTVIRDMDDLIRRTLPATIQVETVLSGGLWSIEVDRAQFENALLNLAINARDAMPEGGKLTVETANIRLDEGYCAERGHEIAPGRYVLIAVSDTGTGMKEEVQAQAFEPFFTTKAEGEGTGLGLSTIYGFAKQSGGNVRIYSEVGEGTTVKLYFPEAPDQPPRQQIVSAPVSSGRVKSRRILVVEDNADVREVVVAQLKRIGFTVSEAANGNAALVTLRQGGAFDLLLTDVVMPGEVQGPALVEIARREFPELKFVFMSGYPKGAMENGNDATKGIPKLTKPIQMAELTAVVMRVLDENGNS